LNRSAVLLADLFKVLTGQVSEADLVIVREEQV